MTHKLRIVSDIHLEFYSNFCSHTTDNGRDYNDQMFIPVTENEHEQTLLLAGDILTAKKCTKYEYFFENLSKRFKKVFVINGNHEFYGWRYDLSRFALADFYEDLPDNIEHLDNNYIELDKDTAIFGGTLWTKFKDSTEEIYAQQCMNDFRIITMSGGYTFTPEMSTLEHAETINQLEKFFKLPHKNKVVMTHHAPSFQSSAEEYKGSLLNAAFATDLEDYIKEKSPVLWLHGHMHSNSDYMIGDTRIICNPYGYKGENKHYIPDLVVDIGDKV